MPRSRSCVIASGEVKPSAAGDDEVRVEADDLLDVDRPEGHDVGQRLQPRVAGSRCSRRSRRPGRRRRSRRGSRSTAGVIDTIFWRFGGERDRRALVVGQGGREGGDGRGVGEAAVGAAVATAATSGWPMGRALATQAGRLARAEQAATSQHDEREQRAERGSGGDTRGASGWWIGSARVARNREAPRFDASKGGAYPVDRTVLPTFLSKVRACTVGSATGLPPSREGGHRSGTVPESHRLRDHAAWVWVARRSVAQAHLDAARRPNPDKRPISAACDHAGLASARRLPPPGEVKDMVEHRWLRAIGPGVIALVAVIAIGSSTRAARDRPSLPLACDGSAGSTVAAVRGMSRVTLADLGTGAWMRLDPTLDSDGTLIGQRLAIGIHGRGSEKVMALPPESFAAGPFGRLLLVGADDGTVTRLFAIDAATGCTSAIAEETDVVRRATIDPAGDGSSRVASTG